MAGRKIHGIVMREVGNDPKIPSPTFLRWDWLRPAELAWRLGNVASLVRTFFMPEDKVRQIPFIQSLDRGLTILQAVALSKQPVSLGELTELLGIDRSSAFRLANTLRRRGFLACPAGRKDYILGSSMWRLSHRYDWGNMLIRIANKQLKLLATQINETAHLAIREGKYALFIDHAAASNVIAVAGQVGELVPLYCTAHGKALLADADERELRALIGAGQLRRYTKNTMTSIQELSKDCALIKKRGLCYRRGGICRRSALCRGSDSRR